MFIVISIECEYIEMLKHWTTFTINFETNHRAWKHPPSGQQYGHVSSPSSPQPSPMSGWWNRISGWCLVQMFHHFLLNKNQFQKIFLKYPLTKQKDCVPQTSSSEAISSRWEGSRYPPGVGLQDLSWVKRDGGVSWPLQTTSNQEHLNFNEF